MITAAQWTRPADAGWFWRDRTVDLLLVASCGCTATRHGD
jgi:hypothetical protein